MPSKTAKPPNPPSLPTPDDEEGWDDLNIAREPTHTEQVEGTAPAVMYRALKQRVRWRVLNPLAAGSTVQTYEGTLEELDHALDEWQVHASILMSVEPIGPQR